MGGEDTASIWHRFANGAIGHPVCSWGIAVQTREESLMIAGINGTFWTENAVLTLRYTIDRPPVDQETYPAVTYPDSVKYLIFHFLDCLQQNTTPVVTAEDARAALRISQAAYKAMETGQKAILS